MQTFKCGECGELVWGDERSEDGDICPACIEEPVSRANQERAVEQWAKYMASLD